MSRIYSFLASFVLAAVALLGSVWTYSAGYLPLYNRTASYSPQDCGAAQTNLTTVVTGTSQYCLAVTLAWPQSYWTGYCLNYHHNGSNLTNGTNVVITQCYANLAAAQASQLDWQNGKTTDCYIDSNSCVIKAGTFPSILGPLFLIALFDLVALVALLVTARQCYLLYRESLERESLEREYRSEWFGSGGDLSAVTTPVTIESGYELRRLHDGRV